MLAVLVVTGALTGHLQLEPEALVALSERDQHHELLERALDVAPQKRDKKWEKLVLKSALIVVEDESKLDAYKFFDKEIDRVRRFPHLLKSDKYRVFHERGLRDSTKACFDRLELVQRRRDQNPANPGAWSTWGECRARGMRLYETKDVHHKTLTELSKILWRRGAKELATLSIDKSLKMQKGAQRQVQCEQEFTDTVTSYGLREDHDSKSASAARDIAFKQCREVFVPEVKSLLAREDNKNVFANACPELKSGGLLKKRCKRALSE